MVTLLNWPKLKIDLNIYAKVLDVLLLKSKLIDTNTEACVTSID